MRSVRHKAFAAQATEMGARQVRVICSTGDLDRSGEQIVQSGIDLSAYKTNPVVLWAHDPTQPIGRASNVALVEGKLTAEVEFAPVGISPKADEICGMVKSGFVNTVSIGFDPLLTEPMDTKKPKGPERYLSIDLMELSFVSIPANKGALVVQRSLRTRAAESTWKVCGADDLTVDNEQDWNGRDAAKRILDDAGFDTDEPDHERAMRGFLVYDSANPDLRGAYKLPFSDIVSGKLVAVASGIRAAASRISQTDIPTDVQKEAQALLDKYEAKIKADEKAATALRMKTNAVRGKKGFGTMKIKSLWDISRLVYIMSDLGYAQTSAKVEAALEGDESKVPDMLLSLMQDLGTALIAMTAEEVSEAIAEAKGALGEENDGEDTDGLDEAETVIVLTSKTPALRKFRSGLYKIKAATSRVKAGKKISNANSEVLRDAVGMHKDAMKIHAKAIKAVEACLDDSDTPAPEPEDKEEPDTTSTESKSRAQRVKMVEALRIA
jgi:HK97 family phage prohead protease